MTTKATWLFNGSDNKDSPTYYFGFSESWYTSKTGVDLIAAMDEVSKVRRLILAYGCSIVGYRISEPDGMSTVVRKDFPAPAARDFPNLPVDAALCQVGIQNSQTRKKFWFHNLPDDYVVKGKIDGVRNLPILTAIAAYAANQFQVRYQVQNLNAPQILSVTDTGLVTTIAAHGLNAGNSVTVLRCRDINNRAVRGRFIVGSVPTATTLTLVHWQGNVVARSGRVRVDNFQYGNAVVLGDKGIVRGGSRKVGRPFFQLRGRAPARH